MASSVPTPPPSIHNLPSHLQSTLIQPLLDVLPLFIFDTAASFPDGPGGYFSPRATLPPHLTTATGSSLLTDWVDSLHTYLQAQLRAPAMQDPSSPAHQETMSVINYILWAETTHYLIGMLKDHDLYWGPEELFHVVFEIASKIRYAVFWCKTVRARMLGWRRAVYSTNGVTCMCCELKNCLNEVPVA